MNVSVYLMVIFLLFVMVFCLFHFFLYFSFLEWNFLILKFSMYQNSLVFSFILLVVTLSVLIFSSYYLNGELYFYYYLFLLMLFVASMYMLNFSNDSFMMLLSWDLLGITSFFLVLFYNNWDSNSGSMNTVMTNRLGDFFMFVFFSGSLFLSFFFFSYGFLVWGSLFFLVLTAFTKSAQFPFSGWLPKAMSAPTPVSSLVHSSTLVTAGLLLLFNFSFILMNFFLVSLMMFVSLFTTMFSSVSALVEEDMKKVVALSTLSQMGFSMLTLSLGYYMISLLHLLSHALFKSCLFMQVGYLIHCSFGQQDGRTYSNLLKLPYFIQLQILLTLFCLCGLFFFSGLVSKDTILEYFYSNSWFVFFSLMFFVTVFFTFFYSYRLWKILFLKFSLSVSHFSSSVLINFLSLLVSLGSIFFIWWMSNNLLFMPSFFIYFDFYVPILYMLFFFLILIFVKKFFIPEFMSKFTSDYLPKLSLIFFFNFKFSENFYYKLSFSFISSFFSLSNLSNFYLISNYFNSLLFVVLFFFIFIWG